MPRAVHETHQADGREFRARLLAHAREQAARPVVLEGHTWPNTYYQARVDAIEAGEPIVIPHTLHLEHRFPTLRAHPSRWVQVRADGRLLPVEPIRDPAEPMSITGWRELTT